MSLLGAATVTRWELKRLLLQRRIQVVLGVCLAGPWLFSGALAVQGQEPKDTLFGLWVHTSGWATPLVVLGFAGQWAFPIIVAAIASGVFAGEDEAGIWAGLLTHSRSRIEVFSGKILAAMMTTVVAVVGLAASSIVAGIVTVGHQPLVGLSGNQLSGGSLAVAVIESWLIVLPPVLAFAAVALLFSSISRHVITAVLAPIVLGLLFQLDTLITGGDPFRHLLVSTPIEAWHGLFAEPVFLHPLWRGLIVSAVWLIVSVALSATAFRRREFSGS